MFTWKWSSSLLMEGSVNQMLLTNMEGLLYILLHGKFMNFSVPYYYCSLSESIELDPFSPTMTFTYSPPDVKKGLAKVSIEMD